MNQINIIEENKMQAASIHYDEQQNMYYKIDKETGHAVKAHRNGSELFYFKPEYSGSDYRLRRQKERDLSPPSLSKPAFQVKYVHKHTIPLKDVQRHTKSQSSMAAIASLPSHSRNLVGYESRIMQSRIKPALTQTDQKLTEFTRLKDNLQQTDHSPKAGYEGSLHQENICRQFKNESIKDLLKKSNVKQTRSVTKIHHRPIEVSSRLILKEQLSKQREIFLRFHANYRPQENQRQLKEQKERKTNLKILEGLFISRNNRETSSVYH